MLIGVILPPDHPWRTQAEQIGTVTFDGRPDGLTAAIRTPQDLMLINLTLLQLEDILHIQRYCTLRDKTRIVVSYANDTRPGNPILSELIAMHVKDVVPDDMPLAEALARNPGYGDVAQWRYPTTEVTGTKKWPFKAKKPAQPARQPAPLYFSTTDWGRLEGIEIIYTADEVRTCGFNPYGRAKKTNQVQLNRSNRPLEEWFAEWWAELNEAERIAQRENLSEVLRKAEAEGLVMRARNGDYIRCLS